MECLALHYTKWYNPFNTSNINFLELWRELVLINNVKKLPKSRGEETFY